MLDQIRLTQYSHGGGCACKLGSLELAEVLTHVKRGSTDPALLVGLDAPDDAAVYEIAPGLAIVQTVDFFTPIVDDPFTWGRIAAANALSDIYAMGGKPVTALNLVAWPRSLDFALLGKVLEGGESICAEAGVSVVGGHSVDDPEPKFGLAVTGTVNPEQVLLKTGVREGDELVLTKAVGTGVISSAIKQGIAPAESEGAAIASMTALNRDAAEAMVTAGASGATDVTGFGLVGHLLQMLGPDLDAALDFGSIPLLTGALELVAKGVLPGGSRRNEEAGSPSVSAEGLSQVERRMLFDAQTSGGLLIAIAPDRADALLDDLKDRGVDAAARIGSVRRGSGRIEVAA